MDTRDWGRVRAVFEGALELPAAERAAFVARECGGEADLAREVERLLGNAAESGDFLRPPDVKGLMPAMSVPDLSAHLFPGAMLGAYRIERVIGAGGMGTVYEARQERPARTVALKVMRFGVGAPDALERFRLEADILGRLRHPGIATIHEMGTHRITDADGRTLGEVPFLAMELVEDARDLLRYAREEGLSLGARLDLFREVCEAVHHGHQKGIIHRDLKPGNVLVDASGRARVIDYGVARVSEGHAGLETRSGHLIGTLQYLAPERVDGETADVVSDVYALGVILYQLLTGASPCDVTSRSFPEAIERIRSEAPKRPSAHVPGLPRELDWIALKALEKHPAHRYGTAAELAADLVRYRNDEPVEAGQPSKSYRVAKFVRRHRFGVGAAAAVLLSLIAGIVGTGFGIVEARAERNRAFEAGERATAERNRALAAEAEAREAESRAVAASDEAIAERNRALEAEAAADAARRAEREQREAAERDASRAQAALGFLQGAFDAVSPRKGGDREVLLIEFLELVEQAIGERASPIEPSVELVLRQTVARAYENLGRTAEAEPHLARAAALSEAIFGPDDRRAVRAGIEHGTVALRTHGPRGLAERFESLLERARTLFGEDDLLVLDGTHALALCEYHAGDYLRAAGRFETLYARCVEREGPDSILANTVLTDYANCVVLLGDLDAALPLFRAALDASRRTLPETHPDLLTSVANVGMILLRLGRLDEAEGHLRDARAMSLDLLGTESDTTLRITSNLALLLKRQGEHGTAEQLYRETIEIGRRILAPDSVDLVSLRMNLGTCLHAAGKLDEALPILEAAVGERREKMTADHPETILAIHNLGALYEDLGRFVDAEACYGEAAERESRRPDPNPSSLARYRGSLDRLLERVRPVEAAAPRPAGGE